jgi:excisionase family DNA binding protein
MSDRLAYRLEGDAAEGSSEKVADLVFRLPVELLGQLVAEVVDRALEQASELLRLETEPYMNAKEAAAYLACRPQRIHELVHQGRLPRHKDGSRLLFRRTELDACLDSRP